LYVWVWFWVSPCNSGVRRAEWKWGPGLTEQLFGIEKMPSGVWHLEAKENEMVSAGAIAAR